MAGLLGVEGALDGAGELDGLELLDEESEELLAEEVDGEPAIDDDFDTRESVR